MEADEETRVEYRRLADGSYDITIRNPEPLILRTERLPMDIRVKAAANFHKTLTLDEQRKMRAAEIIGEPAYTAVWDDLVTARAELLLQSRLPPNPDMDKHNDIMPDRTSLYRRQRDDRSR